MMVDKNKNVLNSCPTGASPIDEKMRGIPAGEGWNKGIKRKRSTGNTIARTTDGDLGTKPAMPQIHACESRPRSRDDLSFSLSHANRMDGSSQQIAGIAQDLAKKGHDYAVHSTIQGGHPSTWNVGHGATNGTAKTNAQEFPINGGQSYSIKETKRRTSRPSKPASNSFPLTSPNLPQTSGTIARWEHTQYPINGLTPGTSNNHKCPLPSGTTSPATTQWGGQRQLKSSRARRMSVMSPVSSHGESESLTEGFPSLKVGAESANDPSETMLCKVVLGNTQKVEPATFSIKKNISQKEEHADGVKRHVRNARSLAKPKFGVPFEEKIDVLGIEKPTRSGRSGSDRSESNVCHPPSKKAMDHGNTLQPRKFMNNCSLQHAGDYCDDHDEMIAAAAYVHCTRNVDTRELSNGSSKSFWDKMRPYFDYVSSDKIAHLQDLIKLAVDMDECFGTDVHKKDGVSCEGLSLDFVAGNLMDNEPNDSESIGPSGSGNSADVDPNTARCRVVETNGCLDRVVPLSQRLLAAIIPENDAEFYSHDTEKNFYSEVVGDYLKDVNCFIDSEVKNANNRLQLELNKCFPLQPQNYLRSNASGGSSNLSSDPNSLVDRQSHGITSLQQICTAPSDLSKHPFYMHSMGEVQSKDGDVSGLTTAGCMYEHMSLDGKIILELQSIGIYLEDVPDLCDGDEEIDKNICALKSRLREQMGKSKEKLCSLNESVQNQRAREEGKLELLAMNKLVQVAYGKLMSGRGSHVFSHRGGANKLPKQADLAFAKRVLDKWKKFEDTGKSCFSEPPYRDVLFSTLLSSNSKHDQAADCLTGLHLQNSATCTNIVDKHGSISLNSGGVSLDLSKEGSSMNGMISNEGRKREVPLGEIVGTESSRVVSVLRNTLPSSAKGRSESDIDKQKDKLTRCLRKSRHQLSGSSKVERRTRTRTKQQNITQPTTAASGSSNSAGVQVLSSVVHMPEAKGDHEDHRKAPVDPANSTSRVSNEMEIQDFSILPLHISDDLDSQVDDIDAWLGVDEDSFQDTELMGLEVPMDDLSELDMNF